MNPVSRQLNLLHPLKNPMAENAQPPTSQLRFGVSYPNHDKDRFQKRSQGAKYIELKAPNPTPFDNAKLDDTEVVVFDLETTGLDPKPNPKKPFEPLDDIIEISAVKYKNGVRQQAFYRLIKPAKVIPPEVVYLTGITNEKVQREGVDQTGALRDLASFVGPSAVFVGHNARHFDTRFIRAVCSRLGLDDLKDRFNYDHVADTLHIAQKYFTPAGQPKPANMKLSTIAAFFGYATPGAHRAENDVETAANLYFRLIREIRSQGEPMETFGDLFKYQFRKRKIKVEDPEE